MKGVKNCMLMKSRFRFSKTSLTLTNILKINILTLNILQKDSKNLLYILHHKKKHHKKH